MSHSSSEIEREVEASRANVEDTVEALKDKMSFGQMLDEGMRYFGNRGGSEMVSNLGAQIRDNPLPLVLIGAGLAWLMSGRGTPHIRMPGSSRSDYRYDEGDRDYGYAGEDYGSQSGFSGDRSVYPGSSSADYAGDSAGLETGWSNDQGAYSGRGSSYSGGGSVTGRAGEMLSGAGDTARRTVHGVTDAVSTVASTVAGAASTAASVASRLGRTAASAAESVAGGARVGAGAAWRGGSGAYRGASMVGSGAYQGASWVGSGAYSGASRLGDTARRSVSQVLDTEPLVLAGLGLAVGAAMGAILPRTNIEDEYMGETRDRLREEAEQFAREKFEQGKAVAAEAYRTAKEEAEAQGLTTFDEDSVVGRVGQVARATMERARETAEERGLTALGGSGSEDEGSTGGGDYGGSSGQGSTGGGGFSSTTEGTDDQSSGSGDAWESGNRTT